MHFKEEVLSQFRRVRSYERIDLLCSLLNLCLPFELRFLGTCLEFLGKKDFNELREDERLANNLNHISQLRNLMDENARRKLVLYVSLLKSSNSDCATCFNDTLVSLNTNDMSMIYHPEPEVASKALDELLLLYTISLNHPAFTIYQKTEFASILSRLQDEDRRLSSSLHCSSDSRCSEVRSVDAVPLTFKLHAEKDHLAEEFVLKLASFISYCQPSETFLRSRCQLKSPPVCSVEALDSSSQSQVKSLASPLSCHVTPGSTYVDAPSPTLGSSGSATLVMDSSASAPVQAQVTTAIPDVVSMIENETVSQPAVPLALSNSTNLVMGPNMIVPLPVPPGNVSTSSHCVLHSPSLPAGDIGIQKGSMGPPNIMLGVPHDSMVHMAFPGSVQWGMMMSVPTYIPSAGPPSNSASVSPGQVSACVSPTAPSMSPPGLSKSAPTTPPSDPVSISVPSSATSSVVSNCISGTCPSTSPSSTASSVTSPALIVQADNSPATSGLFSQAEINGTIASTGADAIAIQSPPSSSRPPSPPRKGQGTSQSKNHQFKNSHHSVQSTLNPPPGIPTQPLQQGILLSQQNSAVSHIKPVPTSQQPQSPPPQQQMPVSQTHNYVDTNWVNTNSPTDASPVVSHLKDAIGREMSKYKANLQNYSPDELIHMNDDQLKALGLPICAIEQLRSIVNKLQSTNGINCINRVDPSFISENLDMRRRFQPVDTSLVMSIPPMVTTLPQGTSAYSYMIPIASSPSSNGNSGMYSKGSNNRHHHHLTHQVRMLRLDEEGRRPCSNSSSTSDCSSGSHSPPETPSLPMPVLPPNNHWDRGTWPTTNMHNRRVYDIHGRRGSDHYQNFTQSVHSLQGYSGKDIGSEPWSSCVNDDRNRDDRLLESDRSNDDRLRGISYQFPGMQRNSLNRPRGVSKATPPGIPTIPRGRGHHLMDKSRREGAGSLNGMASAADVSSPTPPFPMSAGATGVPNNVAYSTPVSSFLAAPAPGAPFPAMHNFARFQPGYIHPAGGYPFHPNGDLWQYPQPPHQNPQFLAPVVAFSPAHPPPKLSCYNCGGQGHHGGDCKESTFEEITQQGQYHLDYKPYKEPGDCRDK